jgi:hypothetical protein
MIKKIMICQERQVAHGQGGVLNAASILTAKRSVKII